MGLFHKVSLLDASLSLHDEVLSRLSDLVRHGARTGAQWNGRGMMVLRLIAKPNVAERVLHNGLKDVWRLHPYLLREASVVGPTR